MNMVTTVSIPYTANNKIYAIWPVLSISEIKNHANKNDKLMLPTSPANVFARFRKLKNKKTIIDRINDISSCDEINCTDWFIQRNVNSATSP